MKLGGIESILFAVIIAGVTWFAAGLTKNQQQVVTGSATKLSPEVRAYIDSKISASGSPGSSGNNCAEIPRLIARIADLQVKLGAIEVYREHRARKETKMEQFLENTESIKKVTSSNLAESRAKEVLRIRNDLGRFCASSKGQAAPSDEGQ